jgi:RNA polymerase sigma-70 factor, ECF subfamily
MTAAAVSEPAAPTSFAEVILPLRPVLMQTARTLTRDPVETVDLVQDALERALRNFDRFTPGTNPRAWSIAILSRLFVDRWRRRRRHLRALSRGRDQLVPQPCDAWIEAEHELEDAPAWAAVTMQDVKQAAADLPPSLRHVFELSAFMHLTYSEIGAIVGIPASTVGTRLLRARRRMRSLLLERQLGREPAARASAAAAARHPEAPPIPAAALRPVPMCHEARP